MKNNDPLSEQLAGLIVKEADPTARDRALYHATNALLSTRPEESYPVSPWVAAFSAHRRAFAGGTVVILLLFAIGAVSTIRQRGGATPSPMAAESALLSQMEALFGSGLDAVIELPGTAPDIHLRVDATTTQPSLAQPVFIQFQRAGRHATRVLSYSGRKICVVLEGRRTSFEPLMTGRGAVILNGESFYWTSSKPLNEVDGYRVTACPLPRS